MKQKYVDYRCKRFFAKFEPGSKVIFNVGVNLRILLKKFFYQLLQIKFKQDFLYFIKKENRF